MRAMRWAIAGLGLALAGGAAAQEAPRVVADIPPVQSLAAMAMAGVGEVALIVPPGASPHGFSMRPSQARALEAAQLVISVGPELAPWLSEAADALAGPQAVRLDLLDVPGTLLLAVREEAVFHDDHGDGHDDEDAQDDAHSHDEAGHGHDHGGIDPHAWLNPDNAVVWLEAIAGALARIDPERAETYAANAAAGRARIEAATREAEDLLASVHGRPYVVFHDAFRHFERRFDMPAAAAVSLSDAAQPGARRVARVQAAIEETQALCVFAEPQMPPQLLDSVAGEAVRRGVLDPLGASLTPGADLYPALVVTMAQSLFECLADRA